MTGWPPVSKQVLALILNLLWRAKILDFYFLEKQDFGYVSAIFRAAPKTVIYIDFNQQQAHLQCFGLTHFIKLLYILQLEAKVLVSAGSSPTCQLVF